MIRKLYQKRIVLDFTDHLNDRELYCLIFRDILPAREKKIDWPNNYLHWDCTGAIATRRFGSATTPRKKSARTGPSTYDQPLPPKEPLPYPRCLPREPGP